MESNSNKNQENLSRPLTSTSSSNSRYDDEEDERRKKKKWWLFVRGDDHGDANVLFEEVKKQLGLAGPIIAVNLLQNLMRAISVMFVGHLGELALSGASMATSFLTVTGFSVLFGMVCALDTLCGQAYGAEQYDMLGIQMQRSMIVLFLASVPLAILWYFTGDVLLALGQDSEISNLAGIYAKWMIPALFSFGIYQSERKFLQSQKIVLPPMIISGVATLFHVLLLWLLVFKSGLGFRGAAAANSISYWINTVSLSLYIVFSPSCKNTWTGFSAQAFHGLIEFLSLAIPSAVMVCLEWWAFEVLVLISGLLQNPQLETSVLSIILNTSSIIYMVPYGLSSALSTRTANELGAQRPQLASLATRVGVILASIEGTTIATIMILARNVWGYCYSNEAEVVEYVARIIPLSASGMILDSIQCVLAGAVRGCGRQSIGALINLGAYYVVGIPLALVFGFVLHLGGMGLWMGAVCGIVVQLIVFSGMILRTDWYREAKKAQDRVFGIR